MLTPKQIEKTVSETHFYIKKITNLYQTLSQQHTAELHFESGLSFKRGAGETPQHGAEPGHVDAELSDEAWLSRALRRQPQNPHMQLILDATEILPANMVMDIS